MAHLYIFFCEVFVQIFCPFQIVFVSSVCILYTNPLSDTFVVNLFSQTVACCGGQPPRRTPLILASQCLYFYTVSSPLEQTHVRFSKRNCESDGMRFLRLGHESHCSLHPALLDCLLQRMSLGISMQRGTKTC